MEPQTRGNPFCSLGTWTAQDASHEKKIRFFLVRPKENWTKRKLLGPRNQKKIAPENCPLRAQKSCLFCYGTQEMTQFRAPELRNPQIPCSRAPNPSNLALRPSRNLCLPTKAYRGLPSAPGFLIEKCPLPTENSQRGYFRRPKKTKNDQQFFGDLHLVLINCALLFGTNIPVSPLRG